MIISSDARAGLRAALLVVIADQATKWWIVHEVMQPPRVIEITPFFNLVLGWNRGISFGLFNTDSPINAWLLPLIATAIVIVLSVWLYRVDRTLIGVAIGLIIGGAIGNVIDRLHYGAVADFIDIHVAGFHWPAFNVADSGITVGAVLLVADSLFGSPKTAKNEAGVGVDEP